MGRAVDHALADKAASARSDTLDSHAELGGDVSAPMGSRPELGHRSQIVALLRGEAIEPHTEASRDRARPARAREPRARRQAGRETRGRGSKRDSPTPEESTGTPAKRARARRAPRRCTTHRPPWRGSPAPHARRRRPKNRRHRDLPNELVAPEQCRRGRARTWSVGIGELVHLDRTYTVLFPLSIGRIRRVHPSFQSSASCNPSFEAPAMTRPSKTAGSRNARIRRSWNWCRSS